ncbi:MAG: ABC transporter ATP-binding protein [Bacteroidales bacterium]|nr:ABC transporter ATP-binding protein [Bacteroidales bacterium]
MIELRDISKSFPVRGLVLNSLSFSAAPGSSIAITGPSGSGKTTLLNIIGLLERADAGTISFRGSDISSLSADDAAAYRNKNIGFIFQEHLLLPHLTIRENIWLPFLAGGGRDGEPDQEHIARLAERTGITGIMDKYPFQVSGGEAQRAAFVRALANRPALLLADEPTGSLDRKNADMLAQLLAELNSESGSTLIVVTHSERLAAAMEHSYDLIDGKLTGQKR